MARVLIFSGYNDRAVIALCRELTSMHAPFSIIASGGRDPIFRTSYRSRVDAIRTVAALDREDLDRCIRRVQAKHAEARYVIAPTSEFLDQHVLDHREWFADRHCEIPLVSKDLYARVTNKWSFRTMCQAANIAVPALVDPDAGVYPFVAKPRTNLTADGRSLYPLLIHSASAWSQHRAELMAAGTFGDYYFETLVEGTSHYLLYYLPRDPSAPIFSWSQRNLLQQPGGKSMLFARSDTLHTMAISAAMVAMLRATGFHGLAMVEVIRQGDTHVAIELNPRLWGPLQLLRNAGSDLLRAFIEDVLHDRITHADPAAGHAASYLWLGGLKPGMVWHSPRPRWPWLSLTRRLAGDVYLRPDTFGLFLDEWARRSE